MGEATRVWLSAAGTIKAGKANQKGEPHSTAGQYVMDYLLENGESGLKDILSDTDDYGKNYLKKTLLDLKAMGLIEHVNEGGKGVPAVYGLAGDGEYEETNPFRGYKILP